MPALAVRQGRNATSHVLGASDGLEVVGLRFTTDLRMVLYGVILIVAMLVFPGGIGGWFKQRRIARWRKLPYGDPQ